MANKNPDPSIRFQAQVVKVQSMTDGALRVTLDMPENLVNIAALLMESKRQGGLLEIAAVPIRAENVRKSKKSEEPLDDYSVRF